MMGHRVWIQGQDRGPAKSLSASIVERQFRRRRSTMSMPRRKPVSDKASLSRRSLSRSLATPADRLAGQAAATDREGLGSNFGGAILCNESFASASDPFSDPGSMGCQDDALSDPSHRHGGSAATVSPMRATGSGSGNRAACTFGPRARPPVQTGVECDPLFLAIAPSRATLTGRWRTVRRLAP